jgi:DNA polymerase-3 subunit delta'
MFNLFENSKNFDAIKSDLHRKSLSHAYLFLSCDELSNNLFAENITRLILCENKNSCGVCESCIKMSANSHPDALFYPKGSAFVVDDANDLGKHILEKPMINDKKIIVIKNIDESTIQAQNKILKNLEEPPASTIFLLTAKNESKILPTIISRARKVLISSQSIDLIKKYLLSIGIPLSEKVDIALKNGEGWVGKTLEILNNDSFISEKKLANEIASSFTSSKSISIFSARVLEFRKNLKEFLKLLSIEFFSLLEVEDKVKTEGILKIIKEINLASQNIDRNVNPNLIIDNLLMKILETKYYHKF